MDIIDGILPVDVRCFMILERDVDLEMEMESGLALALALALTLTLELESVEVEVGRGRRAPDQEHLTKRHNGRAGVLVLFLDLAVLAVGIVMWWIVAEGGGVECGVWSGME